MAQQRGALTVATAPGFEFASVEDLKLHYKTDWHRYNLKRKVAGLPMVSLDLFERVANHAALQGSAERVVNTAHLKKDKPRRQRLRRAAYGSDAEGDDAETSGGSDGEWEEVGGEEAEAALMELDSAAPAVGRDAPADASSPDEDEEEEEEEAAAAGEEELVLASHISLADNGFELCVGRRILGARELARYYKQRPRPAESKAVVVATENLRDRGLVLVGRGGKGLGKAPVSKEQARSERKAYRTEARLRLKTEMGGNGAMFRGFRTAGPG